MRSLLILALLSIACFSNGNWLIAPANAQRTAAKLKAPPARFTTEIVVRTVRNMRTQAEVRAFVHMAARHGVHVINLAVKQDEDDEIASGFVFYASAIAPRAPGYESFDVLKAVIDAAHSQGIKVRAWVPQFHDQVAVRKNPDWQMQSYAGGRTKPYSGKSKKEYFVNPLSVEVQDYQRSILAEIARNYDVDGIVLDWMRFDDYNMDLGSQTRTRFKSAFGYDPIGIDFSTDNRQRREWNSWRTGQIAHYVKNVRETLNQIRPGLELGVYVLPPEFVEVGQDAAQFSQHVDFLAPMAYFKDWGYPIDWVHNNVLPQAMEKARGAAVVPVMGSDWSDAAFGRLLTHLRRDFPEISTLSWFVYGAWTEATFRQVKSLPALPLNSSASPVRASDRAG